MHSLQHAEHTFCAEHGSGCHPLLTLSGVCMGWDGHEVLHDINLIDFGVLILSSVLTFVFAFTLKRNVIDRAEGALLLVLYAAYTAYLLLA